MLSAEQIDLTMQACLEGCEDWHPIGELIQISSPGQEGEIEAPQQSRSRAFLGSVGAVLGKGLSVAGAAAVKAGEHVVKLGAEKLRDAAAKRRQVLAAREAVASFPAELRAALMDGVLTEAEERSLRERLGSAGVPWDTVVATSQPLARAFVSQALANATADGVITNDEERQLWRYVDLFRLRDMREMIASTIARVRAVADLERNVLPSPRSAADLHWLASGETLYRHGPASRQSMRANTAPGEGMLYITSERISFVAPRLPVEYSIAQVRHSSHAGPNVLNILTARKGQDTFFIADAEIASALVNCLCRVNNRTATVQDAETTQARRRITREVRNAVWIRDGGLCVECGADDYLEFDHVIPVSRGGSNAENNIQLLCRRCNNTKSDRI